MSFLLSCQSLTKAFGPRPLFKEITFGISEAERAGLIGPNGAGKSTFMKILDGSLEPSAGNVSVTPGERLGKLHQDQFAFEEFTVLDTVMMGNKELWAIKQEKDAIYANPEATEADYMRAAELEGEFAELDASFHNGRDAGLLVDDLAESLLVHPALAEALMEAAE